MSRWVMLGFAGLIACSSTTEARRMTLRNVSAMQATGTGNDRSRCDATRPGRSASEYDTNGDGVPDVRKVFQTMGEAGETW